MSSSSSSSSAAVVDVEPADDSKEIEKLTRIMREVCLFRMGQASSVMQVDDSLAWLTGWWVDQFAANNLVDKDQNVSFADIQFIARCSLLACKYGAQPAHLTDILPLTTELAIVSSRHSGGGVDTGHAHTIDTLHTLQCRVANYVHEYIQMGTGEVCKQLKRLALTPIQLEELQVPDRLHAQFIALQYVAPPEVDENSLITRELADAGINRYTREDAERDRKKQMAEAKGEEAEEPIAEASRGWLWQRDIDAIVLNFIPLASRLFYQFTLENAVAPKEAEPATPITVTQRSKAQSWLMAKTTMRYNGTDFPALFRDMVLEFQLPIGARQQTQRSIITRSDASTSASTLMENEVGPDMAQLLSVRIARIGYETIAADPKHPLYDLLMFCMFTYTMKQSFQRIDVAKQSFVHPNAVRMDSFERKEVAGQMRRPVMTQLNHRWMIHTWWPDEDEARWTVATDVTHMIFQWLSLMRSNVFQNHTDHRISITAATWLDEAFPRRDEQ